MATTHPTAVRNTIADTVTALADVGTTAAGGQWELQTSGSVEVATLISSSTTAFGVASVGVCTAATINDDTSATGGTATKYELQNRDALAVCLGSVSNTGGSGDIKLSTEVIGAGVTVQLTSFTYTAPP